MKTLIKSDESGKVSPARTSFFDDFFMRDLLNRSHLMDSNAGALPAVNIHETATSFEFEVAAPGRSKDDFTVELDNDVLVVSSKSESQSEEVVNQELKVTRKEFTYSSFKRSFSLPERMIIGEEITAQYKNGILYISVPKTEDARIKPAKQIQIK